MKPTLIPLQGEQAEVSPFPLHCPVYITNTSTDTNSSGDHTNTSAGHGHGRSILAPGRSQIIAQGSVTEVLLQMGLPKKRKHGREREHGDLELLYRVSVSLPLHLQNSNRDTNANTDANADKDAKSNMSCLCYKSDLRYSHGCPVSVSIHGSESDSDSDSNSNAWMDGIILGITEMPTYDIRRESGDYSSDTFFYVVELLDSNGDGNGHSSTDSEKASTGKPRNVTVLHDVSPSEVRFRLPKNENTRTCEIKPNRQEEEEVMVPKRNINRREKELLDSTDSENKSTGKPRNVTVLHDISPSEVRRGLATNDNIKIKSNRREKEDIVPKRNINRQEKEEVIVIKCESETEHQIEAEKEMEKEYETDDNKTDADADADPTSVCSNSINVNSNRNANLRIKIDAGAKAEAAFVQDINLQIRQDGALTRKNMKHGTGTCNEHDNYNGKGHHDDGYAADSIATAQSYSHDPNSHKVKVEFDLKDDRDCDDNYRGVPDPVITSSISAPVRRQRQQIPTLRPLASLCTGVSKSGPVVVAAAVSVLPESKLYTKPEPRPDTSTTALPAAMQTCSLNKRKSHKLEANRGDDASETSNMDKDSDVDADADADDTSPSKRICVERNSSVNMDLKNHLGFEGADVDATDACTGTNSGEEIICLSSDDEAVLDPASMKIPKRRRRSIKVDSHHSVVDDNRNQGQIGLDTGIETARFCDDVPPTTCPRPPPLHESHQSSQFRPGIRGYAIMDKPARMNQAQSTYYSPRKCQGKNRRKPKPPSPPKVFPFFSIVQFSISSSSIFGKYNSLALFFVDSNKIYITLNMLSLILFFAFRGGYWKGGLYP